MKKTYISETLRVSESKLLIIAGPCQIESREHTLGIASELKKICEAEGVALVFKASYDKANRTSLSGARGVGVDAGLKILGEVRKELGIPVLTDVHTPEEAAAVAEVVDVLQTPAFLCRQTDLLLAVGRTGKAVNVKKGQFLHPADMKYVAEKIASTGNNKIFLCERGSSFGYRDLVVDMRGLMIMREFGYPVIFDATHSVQSMGGAGGASTGARQYVVPLLKAALSVGVRGIFVECHPEPDRAPSDGPNMIPLHEMTSLVKTARRYFDTALADANQ